MQKTLLFLWSGVICPHFHVSSTCELLMMMLLRRSQKGSSMDDEHALTDLGRMKSHPWALLGLIFSSTAFTIWCWIGFILGDPGADSGGEGKSKGAEKYSTKKSKERREEPLGTMSYQTSSKRSPPFWLLIGQKNTKVFWHQENAGSLSTD